LSLVTLLIFSCYDRTVVTSSAGSKSRDGIGFQRLVAAVVNDYSITHSTH